MRKLLYRTDKVLQLYKKYWKRKKCLKFGMRWDSWVNYYKSKESKKASTSGGLWRNLSKPLIRNNKNKYKSELSTNEILIFESINKKELQKLEYELVNSDSKLFSSFTSGEINKFNLINSYLKKRLMKIKMILKKN